MEFTLSASKCFIAFGFATGNQIAPLIRHMNLAAVAVSSMGVV
jgi:hypothetical protein